LKRAIAAKVKQINKRLGRPGWQPVDYDYRNFPFEEVTSWYCRADIMLVTPLADGQNLIAKEYVAARPQDDGVLILSEMAGAAAQLREALLVNPQRPGEMAAALERALAMSAEERRARHAALRVAVQAEDAQTWAKRFERALREAPRRRAGVRD
jgi:trehalose-6-phosphate synthase